MDYALKVSKLTKNYPGKRFAIRDLDLKVPRGSIFGLLGRNGAGKSTLINILAGTVVKSSGTAEIMGNNIDVSPKEAKKSIGIVPQEVVIDSFFPLKKSLEFTGGYYGMQKKDIQANSILKMLSLYDKRAALPKQLSGGMRRRFLIAKALVHKPPLLILDEPTAGVDIELRDQLWDIVKTLNKQGTTIIITTHYLFEAQELCDRIAFIKDGRIIHEDKTKNMLDSIEEKHIRIEFAKNIVDAKGKLKFESKLTQDDFEVINNKTIKVLCKGGSDCNIQKMLKKIASLEAPIKHFETSSADLEYVFKKIINN